MLKKAFYTVMAIFNTVSDDNITVYSAYTSFYIVISVVPFLILALMLTGRFVTFTVDEIVSVIEGVVPKSVESFVRYIVDEILTNDSVSVISIHAVMLLWTASRSVVALGKGLDCVYKVKEKRSFISSNFFGLFYTTMFLLAIFVSLGLMVFGNVVGEIVSGFFPLGIMVVNKVLSAKLVISLIILTFVFTCIYTFVTGRKLNFLKQIPGAVFTSVAWSLFSYIFSIYIDNFSNKSYLYGSLTALIILMLWIYFCIIFVFIGGELNYYLMHRKD
ncbi:MAG: YihY/virulence factor BrkB family protein [Clostridia bacterium]